MNTHYKFYIYLYLSYSPVDTACVGFTLQSEVHSNVYGYNVFSQYAYIR